MSLMAGCSRKIARHFASGKEILDSSSSSPKFLPKEAPANVSQLLCGSPIPPDMTSCLNSAVTWVSPYSVYTFSSCSFCHPCDNNRNLYCSSEFLFPFLLNKKWRWELYGSNGVIKTKTRERSNINLQNKVWGRTMDDYYIRRIPADNRLRLGEFVHSWRIFPAAF